MGFVDVLVASGLTTVVLTSALTFLFRTWITERLKQSIAHEYAVELEKHRHTLKAEHDVALERMRADYAQQSAVATAATASFLDTHRAGHERRLAAIEVLWAEMLRLRRELPGPVAMVDLFPVQSHANLRKALNWA